MASLAAAGDFQQMITKLGLHRALHLVEVGGEDDLVELTHHLAGAEAAQVAALAAGRAGGVLAGNLGKITTVLDLGLEGLALFFAVDEDVAGGRGWTKKKLGVGLIFFLVIKHSVKKQGPPDF